MICMVIPFDEQPAKWQLEFKVRYEHLLAEADIITCTGHEYTKGAMFTRNKYLVDNSDLLLAAYDGKPGGTQMTCEYAKRCGIDVCFIRPVLNNRIQVA